MEWYAKEKVFSKMAETIFMTRKKVDDCQWSLTTWCRRSTKKWKWTMFPDIFIIREHPLSSKKYSLWSYYRVVKLSRLTYSRWVSVFNRYSIDRLPNYNIINIGRLVEDEHFGVFYLIHSSLFQMSILW